MQLRQLFSEKTTIGDPVIVRGLVVLPVFNGNGIPEIVSIELLEEALRRESLKITEVSEGGRVPVLKVDNTAGDRPVLLLNSTRCKFLVPKLQLGNTPGSHGDMLTFE